MTPSRSVPDPLSAFDAPYDPVPPWWRGWRGTVAVLLALALAAAGAVWLALPEDTSCAEGVARVSPEGECVGLTDGSHAFSSDLEHVFGLIRKENERVVEQAGKPGGAPYVSVVYLMRMVPGPGDTNTLASVRHELQGAHIAQYQANHAGVRGDSPQIRLLLAHTGAGKQERDFTLERIRERRKQDRIVAVAGLGTSTDATETTVRRLIRTGLPAVGAVITSNSLEGINGLVRVAPSNADEAAAAAHYLKESHPRAKVLLVRDRRKDDHYSKTLAESFEKNFPADRIVQRMEFDSSRSSVSTYFTIQTANLCQAKPDVVFFAGRGVDLPRMLSPLSGRHCKDRELTVISGDDASQTAQAEGFDKVTEALQRGRIRLVYTGLAHQDAWKKEPGAFDPVAVGVFGKDGRFRKAFPREGLDDGQAIMGHDAVVTAVAAIREATRGVPAQKITGSDVMQLLSALQGETAVAGASGLISLAPNGSPVDKAIPVIEIDGRGRVSTVAVSSRTGEPPRGTPGG
ncbi:ABC transporter substrate-binding protein [Streptomyces thermolineatus]|uniref:ABC transporter substrate-binding protein n=1 Tax=Streptomyces thermolineatus TaxID=44033 RepID=A0ABP5YXL1_9ACTN